jgi:hypothetical protein
MKHSGQNLPKTIQKLKSIIKNDYTIRQNSNLAVIIDFEISIDFIVNNYSITNSVVGGFYSSLDEFEMLEAIETMQPNHLYELIDLWVSVGGKSISTTNTLSSTLPSYMCNHTNHSVSSSHRVIEDDFDKKSVTLQRQFEERFPTTIRVPKKIERNTMYLKLAKAKRLTKLSEDEIIDGIMLATSILPFYDLENDYKDQTKFKNVSRKYFITLFGNNYKSVIDSLIKGTNTGPVIECDNHYIKANPILNITGKSLGYALTYTYRNKGWTIYELKTQRGRDIYFKLNLGRISQMYTNPIVNRIVETYASVELPTAKDLKTYGKELIKKGHRTNKGKFLVSLNGKKKEDRLPQVIKKYSKIVDNPEFSWLEENIEDFKYLTQPSFFIPNETEDNNGRRVVDSIALMSSWIRKLIKIDGQPIREYDYKALHANIALKEYGSEEECNLLQGDVYTNIMNAYTSDVKRDDIKQEFLVLINLPVDRKQQKNKNKSKTIMQDLPLHDILLEVAPVFIKNLYEAKLDNYKAPSEKLLGIETIMQEVTCIEMKKQNIKGLYCYDAMYGVDSKIEEIMNNTAKEFGYGTFVGDVAPEEITEEKEMKQETNVMEFEKPIKIQPRSCLNAKDDVRIKYGEFADWVIKYQDNIIPEDTHRLIDTIDEESDNGYALDMKELYKHMLQLFHMDTMSIKSCSKAIDNYLMNALSSVRFHNNRCKKVK